MMRTALRDCMVVTSQCFVDNILMSTSSSKSHHSHSRRGPLVVVDGDGLSPLVSQFAQHGAAVPQFVGNVSCDDELGGGVSSALVGGPAAHSPALRLHCRCAFPVGMVCVARRVGGQVLRWALGGDAWLRVLKGFLLAAAQHCVASDRFRRLRQRGFLDGTV